ncbi:hypothetical protein [Ekhidna sp.]
MKEHVNYIDPAILTRKFVKTGTMVRIASLALAYLAIIAMSI